MLRKLLCTALVALPLGIQATPINQTIDVVATVPSEAFYVKPQTGWPSSPVQLTYDPVRQGFDTYRLALQVKNTYANVSAALAFDPILTEESSASTLPLSVAMGARSLGVAPVVVHTQSPDEAVYALTITSRQLNPAIGNYSGAVSLVFDAVATAP